MIIFKIMSFKDRLRKIIEYKGLLMKQVAIGAGIKQSTFLSYVDARERMPPADVAVRIANVLGVSVEYLMDGTNSVTTDAEIFYRKYRKYNDLLEEIDKLSVAEYSLSKEAIFMMVLGFQHADINKRQFHEY